jgi:hypothetical protein
MLAWSCNTGAPAGTTGKEAQKVDSVKLLQTNFPGLTIDSSRNLAFNSLSIHQLMQVLAILFHKQVKYIDSIPESNFSGSFSSHQGLNDILMIIQHQRVCKCREEGGDIVIASYAGN